MLESLRKAAGTWVAKLLLIVLVVSFAVWGISGQIATGVGNNVITAGGTGVSVTDYRLAYDRQLMMLSQQLGTRLTREQASAFGIDQQVLSQLVAGALLDEQASRMGLGLSRDRLAQLTAEDPAFHGAGGRFDRQLFEYVLNQVGMRPEDYLRNRQQVAIRQQIVEAVSDDLKIPDTFLRATALYRGEDRTVEFVAVPRSVIEPVPTPSDEQLGSFFAENKAKYAAPEFRKISYVKLEPVDIADENAISDEQVRAYYDQNIARYTEAEKRTIEQLVFGSEDAARAAAERARGGTSFEDLVAAEGKSMTDVLLGTFEKSRVADPAIAEAAFGLQQGQVSDVVNGNFGSILLRVTAITPEVVRPFDEVSAEIRRDLAVEEAARVIYDVHDSYEDARASGESMTEAAARLHLNMVTLPPVDSQGVAADGTFPQIPEAGQLLPRAFESDVGVENAPIEFGNVGFLFFEVDEVTPARDRTLDEIRERVATDWTEQEASTRLIARVNELRGELDAGKPFAQLAEEAGLELQTKRGLRREADDADLGRAGVAAVFKVTGNGSGIVAGADQRTQILFKVTETMMPVDADGNSIPEDTRNALSSGLSDDLLDQLVARLQGQYPVSVNQRAIEQALSF